VIDVAPKLLTTAQNIVTQLNKLDELKKTVSGTSVSVSDVSHVEHNVGVNLTSKNLLDMSSLIGTSKTANGGTLSVGEDGGITGSGTPTGGVELPYVFIQNPPLTTLTFSRSGTFVNFSCVVYVRNGPTNLTSFTLGEFSTQKVKTLNLANYPTATNILFNIKRNNNNTEMSGTMYLQCELGDAATAYTPFVSDFSAVQVSRYGKNLFDKDNPNVKSWYIQGGKIHLGTNGRLLYIPCKPNTAYTMSKTLGAAFFLAYITEEPKANISCYGTVTTVTDNLTITTGADALYIVSYFYNAASDTITLDEMLSSIQIEVGTTATDYEQYKVPTTYTANAAGTVDGIRSLSPSMTLLSNNPAAVINCKYYPTGSEQRQTTNAGILSVLKSIRSKFGKYP
jgi:hypothetical protein